MNVYVFQKGFSAKDEIDLIWEEAKEIFALQMQRLGIVGSPEVSEGEFGALEAIVPSSGKLDEPLQSRSVN